MEGLLIRSNIYCLGFRSLYNFYWLLLVSFVGIGIFLRERDDARDNDGTVYYDVYTFLFIFFKFYQL
jgi:hypothetical protein